MSGDKYNKKFDLHSSLGFWIFVTVVTVLCAGDPDLLGVLIENLRKD